MEFEQFKKEIHGSDLDKIKELETKLADKDKEIASLKEQIELENKAIKSLCSRCRAQQGINKYTSGPLCLFCNIDSYCEYAMPLEVKIDAVNKLRKLETIVSKDDEAEYNKIIENAIKKAEKGRKVNE